MWTITTIFLLLRVVNGCGPVEVSYDYPGDDILFVDDVESAEECSKICGRNSGCKSWTYIKKPGHTHTRRCYVKSSVRPNRTQNDCCDSGLPCLEPNVSGCEPFEVSYDYPGDDILFVDDVESAEECSIICRRNSGCKSWTYIKKPGHTHTRRCHVKSSVKPNRTQNDCCDSGLPCQEPNVSVVGNPTCGGTADGARCVFPFDYEGTTYYECTDADHTEMWCLTETAGKWGNCDCGAVTCTLDASTQVLANGQYNPDCCGKPRTHCDGCSCGRTECCEPGTAPSAAVTCTFDASTQVLANGQYNPDCCGKPRTHCDHCSCGRTECCTASDPTAVNERNSVGFAPLPLVRTFPVSDGCPAGWNLGGSCANNRPQSICCNKGHSENCDESCARRECEQRGTQSNQFGQFTNTEQPGEPYYCEASVQENCDIERGVAYESVHNLLSVGDVNRAEDCSLICGAMSACQSWTYGADSSRNDFRQCKLMSELRAGRSASEGSHSGLPCSISDQNLCPAGGWTRGGLCSSGECCSAPAESDCDPSCRQAQCEAASGTWVTIHNEQPPTCQLQVIPVERDATCLYEDGYDYPGNDITILVNLRSEADCSVACATVSTCRSWTYSISLRNCWLKSGEQENRIPATADLISGLPCVRRRGSGESFIRLNKIIFTAGDALEMSWNNGDVVYREDRLAVYPSSEVQGREAPDGALLWIYACGSQSCNTPLASGSITLTEDTRLPAGFVGWPFPAGSYKVVLLNDANEILVKSEDFFIRDTDQLPTEVRSSSRRLELVAPDSRRLETIYCYCHTPGAGTQGHNEYYCDDNTDGSCENDEECFNSRGWEKSQRSHGCGPLEVQSQTHTTSPRAGLACEDTGLQGVTTRASCEAACATFQGSMFKTVNTHKSTPGCTIRVSDGNRGECQWNSDLQAILIDPNLRHVCTDPLKTNDPSPNRSKRQVVFAPAQANCTFINFFEVATVNDCRVACELAGNTNTFSVGRWNRPSGCWVDPAGSCTWNTQQDGESDSGDFKQVCMRAGRHHDVCVKHLNEQDRDCCGLKTEITCQFGFKLEAPLASHACDVSRCNSDFCNAHPEDGGAYRCVVPEYGWQPKSVGHASCGPQRQYHGKIGLQECVKTCELDPFCKSIFGALDAGDNSCWTCPSFTLRPIEQPNDGEDNDANRDENYKAYQLKRRTKYAFIAFKKQQTCPEGYITLTETECNAVAGAVISTGTKSLTVDNSKPKGCTLPVKATSHSNAAPTWSTGGGTIDENTRLVCKWQVPNDALVSFNFTNFENAMVSANTNDSSTVRDGSKCVDGSITTYCTSALSVVTKDPYLRFDLKEPLMVMRLFIASRGDADVNALGRFTVRVHDGTEWQLCKFRQEVNFNEQWNEVYCEDAIRGTKIEIIQLAEGPEHLAIADVRVQGITPEASLISNPRYETVLEHTSCTADAEIARQVCNSQPATTTACRAEGEQLCNQEINCHGYGLSYENGEVVITAYDKRAADEYECGGDYGLKGAPAPFEFSFKERKGIEDVICIERPCWSYNYPTDEFKHLGCSVGQLAVAEAQVANMRQLRECSHVPAGQNPGEYRARCYARLRFRRQIGEDMWKIFERMEDETTGPVCMTVRRREETQPAELVAPLQNRVRRRLMGLQKDTAGQQCRRRAQVTNNAACNNLLEAADKTVGLYQDSISLEERREALLRRQRRVGIATGILDVASTFTDLDAGVDGKVKNPFRSGNLKDNPSNIGAPISGIAAAIDFSNGIVSDSAAIGFANTEIGLINREANIAKLRDMSDIAAVCDARSTDDLLCEITELREQVDEQFYNVIQLAEVQHVEAMDALARADKLLENTLVTAESIRVAIDQTLATLKDTQALQIKFPNTLQSLEYLRAQYNLFAGEDGVSAMSDKASRNQDWCDFTNTLHTPSLFESLVDWVEAPEFRKTVEPKPTRRSDEQGVWTLCEKEEYRQAFAAAHRSIEIMFNWAHSIREYTHGFNDRNNFRANIVRDQRARMADAFQTQIDQIDDLPSNGAIRCVGDTPKCPSGYHITHVTPHQEARSEFTGLPEPVTEQPCAPDTCSCQHGKAAQGHQCTGHADAKCVECNKGYMLDGDICRLVETQCENGAAEMDRLKLDEHDDQQQYCAACDEGYTLDFKTNDPTRGDFATCEINVCYCDNTTGEGAKGKECEKHWTGPNPAFSGNGASQCASCKDNYQLVAFSSKTGHKKVCEHDDGVRLFSQDHFLGIRTRMDPQFEEVWSRPQQTRSFIVLPGWCIGMRSTSHNWQSIRNPGSVNRGIRIDGEVIACNCHKDQVDRHEAAGFDNFRMQFQGMRRFKCDDPFVDFMKPSEKPWQIWSKHPSDSLIRRGTVDVALSSNSLSPSAIREPSAYHRHHNPGRNWYGGDYDRGFICEHCL